MADPYLIYGAEPSPYSVKVRSYFRYKDIPHEWVSRSADRMEEFQKLAKLPLVPLVALPDGGALQDSTPIIEKMEQEFSEPSIHPDSEAMFFISALVEEYGDEWGNKHMFHYRWWYEPDQVHTGDWIASIMLPDAPDEQKAEVSKSIQKRMKPRISFVGSSEKTKDTIENSFHNLLEILESHLSGRSFLFGERPAFADFGLYAQVYEESCDPTAGAIIKEGYPNTLAWATRMLDPKAQGEFEPWENLAPTLMPLLRDEIGALFLPWSEANAAALMAGEDEMSVLLKGREFSQTPQKYHARSLAAIKDKYNSLNDTASLNPILEEAGILDHFKSA